MSDWLLKIVKTLVLAVISMAAASILVFSVATALAMGAVCLIALLTAYVVSPKDIKAVVGALVSKMDGWIADLKGLVASMVDVIREATETAKAVAGGGMSEDGEATQSEVTVQVMPGDGEEPFATMSVHQEEKKPSKRRRRAKRKPAKGSGERIAAAEAVDSKGEER